ncbi:hypothetical protein TNCV_4275191 [Trichonephila clavipes]|nr:hypothetical protein TNCV_4275191 [Trichonephila clavipes]
MNLIPRLPSRNDSPFSPINISNKVKKFNEWVLFESETNFPEHAPGDISFKASSSIVFRQGSFEVTPDGSSAEQDRNSRHAGHESVTLTTWLPRQQDE